LAGSNLSTLERSYVVHATELISLMLNRNGLAGRIIRSLVLNLFAPYMAIDEVWKHREEWFRRKPALSLDDFIDTLTYYVKIVHIERFKGIQSGL
jgi:hypothetical protein